MKSPESFWDSEASARVVESSDWTMLPVVVTVLVVPEGVVVWGVDWVMLVRFEVSGLEEEE